MESFEEKNINGIYTFENNKSKIISETKWFIFLQIGQNIITYRSTLTVYVMIGSGGIVANIDGADCMNFSIHIYTFINVSITAGKQV